MSYKGPFTLRRNGLPEFFEEQLPLCCCVSISGSRFGGIPSVDTLLGILRLFL